MAGSGCRGCRLRRGGVSFAASVLRPEAVERLCIVFEGVPRSRFAAQKGIADLYELLHRMPHFLKGAQIADKVVGKGAAALMIVGEIKRVHADIISEPAIQLFQNTSIKVTYTQTVPAIINRKGDGFCPVESLCAQANNAHACIPLIDKFVQTSITL